MRNHSEWRGCLVQGHSWTEKGKAWDTLTDAIFDNIVNNLDSYFVYVCVYQCVSVYVCFLRIGDRWRGAADYVAPTTRRRRLFVEHHNNNNIVCTYDVYYRGYANNDALTTSSAIFIMV